MGIPGHTKGTTARQKRDQLGQAQGMEGMQIWPKCWDGFRIRQFFGGVKIGTTPLENERQEPEQKLPVQLKSGKSSFQTIHQPQTLSSIRKFFRV